MARPFICLRRHRRQCLSSENVSSVTFLLRQWNFNSACNEMPRTKRGSKRSQRIGNCLVNLLYLAAVNSHPLCNLKHPTRHNQTLSETLRTSRIQGKLNRQTKSCGREQLTERHRNCWPEKPSTQVSSQRAAKAKKGKKYEY